MTTHLAYVDSMESLHEAGLKAPDADLICDNPFLAEDPATRGKIRNIDRLLTQKESLHLGKASLRLASLIDEKIHEAHLATQLGLVEGHLRIGGISSRLFSSIFYRAAVMARCLSEHNDLKKIDIFTADQPQFDRHIPFLIPRFATPFSNLAKHGFFDGALVDTHPIDVALPVTVNETATSNVFLRAVMTPPGFLLMKILKISRINPFNDRPIFIGGENEALRETMPWLLARGFSLKKMGKLTVPPIYVPDEAAISEVAATVTPLVRGLIEESLVALDEFSFVQQAAIAENILEHLAAGFDSLRKLRPTLEQRVEAVQAHGKYPPIILTNGLFGATGAQVYGLCQARGIKVIDFEHGVTTGLSALSQKKIEYSEVASCDALMVSSKTARASFEKARVAEGKAIHVIGLADKVRKVSYSRFQRFMVRKRLGLKSSETAVLHISTYAFSGNVRPGLGTPTESTVFDANRDLLCKAYQSLPHRIFFKPYPTQRFPYEPPYESALPDVKDIQFLTDEDFRYSRTAADIIVTATPTSTLGWCVGSDVPLIWLDSKIANPLINESLRQQFMDSFMCINIDDPNWPELLHSTLNRDISTIKEEWESKAEARRVLLEGAIFGPSGSVGRRAAGIISGMGVMENWQKVGEAKT